MGQSSLMTTTETARKYLIYFGIFLLVVILLQFCLNALSSAGGGGGENGEGEEVNSAAYREATAELNELGSLPDLPSIPLSSRSDIIFNVDNNFQSKQFPAVNIYAVEQPRERFATETKAEDIAERFGFTNEPSREGEDESVLRWTEGRRIFTYDKVKKEANYTNLFVLPQNNSITRDEETLISEATRLIDDLGFNRPDINLETTEIVYLRRSSNNFEETSPGNATYLQITAHRSLEAASLKTDDDGRLLDIAREEEPIMVNTYTEDYQSAPIEIIIAAPEDRLEVEDIYSANFIDWNIEEDPGAYNYLSPEEAWQNVTEGKGSLQELVEFGFDRFSTGKDSGKEVISFTANYLDTELAYLETEEWSGYLYPIYIFRGRAKLTNSPNQDNADFVFYAYAVEITEQ